MLIIRRFNCIDAASVIVTLSKWLSGTQVHSAEHATHTHTQGDTKERELLKCVVAVKECIRGGGCHLQDLIFKH